MIDTYGTYYIIYHPGVVINCNNLGKLRKISQISYSNQFFCSRKIYNILEYIEYSKDYSIK